MLFEHIKLTAEKCHAIIYRVFVKTAVKPDATPSNSVPIPILEEHGSLDRRIRYLCEARAQQHKFNRERMKAIRSVERSLDLLPSLIMDGLKKSANEDWLTVYKSLIQLHEDILTARLCVEVEEYEALVQQIILLADEIAKASCVEMTPASMFALLLMQVHIKNDMAKKPAKPKRTPRKRRIAKPTTQKELLSNQNS